MRGGPCSPAQPVGRRAAHKALRARASGAGGGGLGDGPQRRAQEHRRGVGTGVWGGSLGGAGAEVAHLSSNLAECG